MPVKQLSSSEVGLDAANYPVVNKWLARGDGIAVFENHAMDSVDLGHRQFLSFGSKTAQIEVTTPEELPQRLPDIGNKIGWKYILVGFYKGANLEQK